MRTLRILILVCSFVFALSAVTLANDSALGIDTIAADYGLNRDEIQAAYDSGVSFQDINHIAFIALATSKSFNEVRKYKDIGGSWEQAASLSGITTWHITNGQQKLIANQLYNIFGTPKATTISLLTQRYHPKAVALIAAIAQVGNVDQELIAAKKYGKPWHNIAMQVNVSPSEVDKCIAKVNDTFNIRASFNDYYGYYGQKYGYKDSDFNSGGYDIEVIKFVY